MWQQQWANTGKWAVTKGKWAVAKGKWAVAKAFLSVSEELTTTDNSYIPRIYNNGNRTWETTVIPSQIWTNG
jgi:hypothetical protein